MLTAHEAREEMERDPVDRVSSEKLEEIQLVKEMFSADMNETLGNNIKLAIEDNLSKVHFEFSVVPDSNDFSVSFFKRRILTQTYGIKLKKNVEVDALIKEIHQVVYLEIAQIEKLGYSVYLHLTSNEYHGYKVHGNTIALLIDWTSPEVKPTVIVDDRYEVEETKKSSYKTVSVPEPKEEIIKPKKPWWKPSKEFQYEKRNGV